MVNAWKASDGAPRAQRRARARMHGGHSHIVHVRELCKQLSDLAGLNQHGVVMQMSRQIDRLECMSFTPPAQTLEAVKTMAGT